ncbi:hypothetical protein FBU30_004506 [Linnemannia zychae]|nr:hypothetical protein FBU30_004506 [Linnemannia zychae]
MKIARKSSRVARALAAARPVRRTRTMSNTRHSGSSTTISRQSNKIRKPISSESGTVVKRSVGRPRTRPLTLIDADMGYDDASNSDEQDSDNDHDHDSDRDNASDVSRATDEDVSEGNDNSNDENGEDSGSEDTNSSNDDNDDEDEDDNEDENSDRNVRSRRPLSSSSSTSIPSSGPLLCPIKGCNRKFLLRSSLTSHIREHTPEEAGYRYPCVVPGCRFFSESRRGHATHSRTCGEDPSASYPCPYDDCQRTFSTANGLAQHRRRHAVYKNSGNKKLTTMKSFAKKYRCHWPGCKKVTTRPKEFEEHLERHAEQQKRSSWQCKVDGCTMSFETRSAMRAHLINCREGKNEGSHSRSKDTTKAWSKKPSDISVQDSNQKNKYRCDVPGCGVALKVCPVDGCDCVLPNTESVEAHALLHRIISTAPPYKCTEKSCHQEYKDREEFFAHMTGHIFEP